MSVSVDTIRKQVSVERNKLVEALTRAQTNLNQVTAEVRDRAKKAIDAVNVAKQSLAEFDKDLQALVGDVSKLEVPTSTSTVAAPKAKTRRRVSRKGGNEQRPPLKIAMMHVMGDKQMRAADVYDALAERDWLPDSNNPKAYIGYVLSQVKDTFELVNPNQRGLYQLKKDVLASLHPSASPVAMGSPAPSAVPSAPSPTPPAPAVSMDADQILAGVGLVPAPSDQPHA